MPPKSVDSNRKGRGFCCSLQAVKHFLQSDTIPEGYNKNDKRALRRRAKSFVLIGDELYFAEGRSRHNKGILVEKEIDENPEKEPDHTQTLRKVLFSEEEQQAAVDKAHIAEDGFHLGMEKTTERVSSRYYWMGIIYSVRNTIHRCLTCGTRSSKISVDSQQRGSQGSNISPVTSSAILGSEAAAFAGVDKGELGTDVVLVGIEENGDLSAEPSEKGKATPAQSHAVIVASVPLIKQEADTQSADAFYIPQEICNYFWQKVEIQVFGPYQAGGQEVYVAIALDCYSQFPEATVMESITAVVVTNFVLNLFCRYGMMEKLSLLQNKVTKKKEFIVNTNELLLAGISPVILFPEVNLLDERWWHIERSLEHFIRTCPDSWYQCLEVCLTPLRFTLPPEADYSPYFLSHGREPNLTKKLLELWNVDQPAACDVRLTEEQEKRTVEMITAVFNRDAFSLFKGGISGGQALETEKRSLVSGTVQLTLSNSAVSPAPGNAKTGRIVRGRKRGRPRKTTGQKVDDGQHGGEAVGEPDRVTLAKTKNRDMPASYGGSDNGEVSGHDSCEDATYQPKARSVKKQEFQTTVRSSSRKRKSTLKALEADIVKKKRMSSAARPPSSFASERSAAAAGMKVERNDKRLRCETPEENGCNATDTSPMLKKKRGRPKKQCILTSERASISKKNWKDASISSLQQLSFDTFCYIVAQYIHCQTFPPGLSTGAQDLIINFSGTIEMKDGILYSYVGKSSYRRFINGEKARFGILRKAHVIGDIHYGRDVVLKFLAEKKMFWKGMSCDVDAFIHACPECMLHNPLHTNSVVKIPSTTAGLSLEDDKTDDNPHLSEDEDDETKYEHIIQFLTDGTFPTSTNPFERSCISHSSKSMTLIYEGSSRYLAKVNYSPDASEPKSVKVLNSENVKKSAIQEYHIENGQHLSVEATQSRLRKHFFWRGMTADVLVFAAQCCMDKPSLGAMVPHRNPLIQSRVRQFQQYYAGNAIPQLDTSLIRSVEVGMNMQGKEILDSNGTVNYRENETHTKSLESRATCVMNDSLMKTVESIIESHRKMLIEKGTAMLTPNVLHANLIAPSRKDAHNCQHCGKFISGNVAYRMHMYKHTGVKPFSCRFCGKTFTTSKSLHVHTRKHTGIKPYLCNQCGREFFRGTSFKYHLKTHNRTKTQPLSCDQCGREFLTQNRLAKHKLFKHPAVPKVFICKHCGRTFSSGRSLKWHEQSHSNPRRFTCDLCGKEFNRKEYLDTHNKTSHSQQILVLKQSPTPINTGNPQLGQHLQIFQQVDQQGESHSSQQLLQSFSLPATANISFIHWNSEAENQTVNHIAITDQAGDPIGHISLGSEHRAHALEDPSARGHITLAELEPEQVSEHEVTQISITQDPASGHICIVEDLGSHVRITEHPSGQRLQVTDSMPEGSGLSEESQLVGDGGVLNQATTTHTVHVMTTGQQPLQASSPATTLTFTAGAGQQEQAGGHLLQPEVKYEVELDPSTLTEEDLNAVQLLTQTSLGQSILHHQAQSQL